MALIYFCEDCKRELPWWRFPWDAQNIFDNHNGLACFKCSKDGIPKNKKHQIFFVEKNINNLIKLAMRNKMTDLRNHLFETLEKIKDKEITTQQAKDICAVAQVIINTVKVEIDYLKIIGEKKSLEFMQLVENAESVA